MNRTSAPASATIDRISKGQLNCASDYGMSRAAVPVPVSDAKGEGRIWMSLSSALACQV